MSNHVIVKAADPDRPVMVSIGSYVGAEPTLVLLTAVVRRALNEGDLVQLVDEPKASGKKSESSKGQ